MQPPSISGVLETGVYVDDYAEAHQFYGGVLGLRLMLEGERLWAYDVCPGQTLLLFKRGACSEDVESPYGMVPGHGATGPSHFAFSIPTADLEAWRAYFRQHGVRIISEVRWPQGGHSLYVLDPSCNVVELATPGLWPNYE